VKKAVMQRSCKRLLFGYKGPGFGSFAGRQKIQFGSLLPAWGREKSRNAAQLQAAVRASELVLLPAGKKSSGFMLT